MSKPAVSRPRIGSLFSGYGGLDLAVEHLTGGETIWFSELNEPVARVFSHHWPDAPNLGDISHIDWSAVPPVDILCGGFPCQDVSTVGKRAGLAPGTRSGLWSFMAAAIDALQPALIVIENVRGLLSSPATRNQKEDATDGKRNPATPTDATLGDMEPTTWMLGDESARPLRALGAVLGDLADLGYDAEWIGIPASLVGAPHHRFRIFITAHPRSPLQNTTRVGLLTGRGNTRRGESQTRHDRAQSPSHRLHTPRTAWLASQAERAGDLVYPDRQHLREWGGYADAIQRWEHITQRAAPMPALLLDDASPRPAPEFVEWFMGLPEGWVTDESTGLNPRQQITALGNGVLPLQAGFALGMLSPSTAL